jgi:hypothetical protein
LDTSFRILLQAAVQAAAAFDASVRYMRSSLTITFSVVPILLDKADRSAARKLSGLALLRQAGAVAAPGAELEVAEVVAVPHAPPAAVAVAAAAPDAQLELAAVVAVRHALPAAMAAPGAELEVAEVVAVPHAPPAAVAAPDAQLQEEAVAARPAAVLGPPAALEFLASRDARLVLARGRSEMTAATATHAHQADVTKALGLRTAGVPAFPPAPASLAIASVLEALARAEAVTARCWTGSATCPGPPLPRSVRSRLEQAKQLVASFVARVAPLSRPAGAVGSACHGRASLLLPARCRAGSVTYPVPPLPRSVRPRLE